MSSRPRAVVLFSGGMDSTVNLLAVREVSDIALALTFDYGQRAAQKEIEVTSSLCQLLKLPHKVLKLPFFEGFSSSLLTSNPDSKVPAGKHVSIDDIEKSRSSATSVWVPNRNGIFLNIAAGFAESLQADWIVPGFNQEEAATFPDNSDEFLKASTKALSYSTSNQVQVTCLTTEMNKTEIVKLGTRLKIDWSWLWPCYFSGEKWCGQCESCQRSKRALLANQVDVTALFSGENLGFSE